MEVLHRTLDDAAETFDSADGLVAEVVQSEIHVVHFGCVVLDVLLQVVQHVEVGVCEQVIFKVVVERSDPACVDSEEETEFFSEVCLFDIGPRVLWNPKFLRISLRAKKTKMTSHKDCLNV